MKYNIDHSIGTKEKLLNIATKLFMENGYENTSVRMILDASNTVAGSFYHFFPSKDVLFESVIEKYLQNYTERISAITTDTSTTVDDKLNSLFSELWKSKQEYFDKMHGNKLHWTVEYALHDKTMLAMLPSIQTLLNALITKGEVKPKLDIDTKSLAAVLLKGIEGLLHSDSMDKMTENDFAKIRQNINKYIELLFIRT